MKIWLTIGLLVAAGTVVQAPAMGAVGGCANPADFNGDGIADLATGRPDGMVGNQSTAGWVTLLYGGDNGSATLTQDTPGIPGVAEDDDRFGEQLAIADTNLDGCGDLVVSAPEEDLGSAIDAGAVWVIPGSPSGLDYQNAYVLHQDSPGFPGVSETGDFFGSALAAEGDAIAIGVPGENHHVKESGSAYLVTPGGVSVVHQDSPGVPGRQEFGDRFGLSVAVTSGMLVVGVPKETVGNAAGAGIVQTFRFRADGTVWHWRTLSQNDTDVSGVSEAYDWFGGPIDVARYTDATGSHLALAVGAPGEGLTSDGWSQGMAHLFVESADAGWRQQYAVHQNTPGVLGVAESGDNCGAYVDLWTAPAGTGTPAMLTMTCLGEQSDAEQGSVAAIHLFENTAVVGDSDRWVKPGDYGLPPKVELSEGYADAYAGLWFVKESSGGRYHGVPVENIVSGEHRPVVGYTAPVSP